MSNVYTDCTHRCHDNTQRCIYCSFTNTVAVTKSLFNLFIAKPSIISNYSSLWSEIQHINFRVDMSTISQFIMWRCRQYFVELCTDSIEQIDIYLILILHMVRPSDTCPS